jgi:transcription elongation factor Elf1/integrase
MIERKNPAISVHSTLNGQLRVDWEKEYNNDFNCPRCNDGLLTKYYYRKSKSHQLELQCNLCQKGTDLSCLIPGMGKKHLPISTHQTLNGKLQVNWHLEYKNEFSCPYCDHDRLIFHHTKAIASNLVLDCTACKKSIYLTCSVPGIGKKHLPISTHQTLGGELQVNWYLEYKNEFSCPHCNHNRLTFAYKKDKPCNLVLECCSCRKSTYLIHDIPGAGKKYSPISTHQTSNGDLKVNWYIEYRNEFSCPHCNHEQLTYCYDKTKGADLTLECSSCHKRTALTCKVSSHIYNYQSTIECPNPLCDQIGHDGQKGWIHTVGDTDEHCKCFFCKTTFDPKSIYCNSWVGSQIKRELLPFNFTDNSWDLRHFGYTETKIRKINFSPSQPEWYIQIVKQYIHYLIKSQINGASLINRKKATLEEFGITVEREKLKQFDEIDRNTILAFSENNNFNKARNFHGKLSILRQFFEWLEIDDRYLICQRDFPKLTKNAPDWLDELVRKGIHENLSKIPAFIARHYLIQEYTAARPVDICQIAFDCLIQEEESWHIEFYQHKTKRWHRIPANREIRKIIEEQQQWIRRTIGSEYLYLFCHFRSIRNDSYPNFSNIKPLPTPPLVEAPKNPMVRVIRMLIENENIFDSNKQKPHFTGRITRASKLQEIRVKHGIKAAQLYGDHKDINTTFQHYTPPTREQVAAVDLPFQKLLMNLDNKFLPWQSLPENLLKNPKQHELDIEISPRLVVYGHCALDPKTPCPVNLYPKCYGCSSFRPSTAKLPLYERQYQGERQRLIEAEKSGAELTKEEAKSILAAMDKWLPELGRLAND